MNEKEIIKIVAESKRSNSICSDINKRNKSNCSGLTKKYAMLNKWQLLLCKIAIICPNTFDIAIS
jgi:hypothetical protein